MPLAVRKPLKDMLKTAGKSKAGLCVSVFEASPDATAGVPLRDFWWISGYLIAILQLGIAAIPWGIHGEWLVFAITAGGTLLAFVTGCLPQWRNERWACRRGSPKTFVLTRGNGAQHALVILGEGRGLDLEDLASSGARVRVSANTRWMFAGLTTLWVALLITVSGMKQNTWFLVAIGALGMLHTVVVAGTPRHPGFFGVHLKFRNVFVHNKVMEALKDTERSYPGLGRSMLPVFFPGSLRPDEEDWWKQAKVTEAALNITAAKCD
jgi:hypothetical protein